jgi:hypothetical protein
MKSIIGRNGRSNIMITQLKKIAKVWPEIRKVFAVPDNDKEYNKLLPF